MSRSTTRRYAPQYEAKTRTEIQRYIENHIQQYNVVEDKNIRIARKAGGEKILYFLKSGKKKVQITKPRCEIMRIERAETMSALVSALVDNCDFSLDSKYLFEVSFPIEKIAEFIGQIHVYDNGRVSVDCVRGGLNDLELADYIVTFREGCEKTGKNKASRIFLTPKFFEATGISLDKLCSKMRALREYRRKKNELSSVRDYCAKQFERRATSARIAGLIRTDLIAKLERIKNKFVEIEKELNELAALKKSKRDERQTQKKADKRLALAEKQSAAERAKKSRWAEKSVHGGQYLDAINALFPT